MDVKNIFLHKHCRKVNSLIQELYKMKISKGGGITSCFMRVSKTRDQLQEFEEIISNKEMNTILLNELLN